MNERIKELAVQAGMHYRALSDEFCEADTDGVPFEMMERFAELVDAAAVARERERLKALKPVVWQHLAGRNIPFYALDEVTK